MRITKLTYNDVVHCSTLEEALAICQLMNDKGFKWCSDESYLDENRWKDYKENTCYYPSGGSYCYVDYFKINNYNIIPASVFLNSNTNYEIY
jgi:hypothetical protein